MFRFALAASSLMLPFPSAAIARHPGSPPPPRNGEELLSLMRDRYVGKWYRTLTFTQETTLPDGKIETWYEALELPGRLRIDIAPLDSGKTLLFRNDSLYVFDQETLKASHPLVHPLMVLGFDVYQAPVKETAQKLRGLKFDLSNCTRLPGGDARPTSSEPTREIPPAPSSGSTRSGSTSSAAWSPRRNPAVINETIFDKYLPLGGGWVETEVLFLANGKQQGKEEYSDLKANVKLDPTIFDPSAWTAPGWVGHGDGQRP